MGCLAIITTNNKLAGLLHSPPIPDRPWQSIGMDFIGILLKLNKFNYLLVVIDQLTVRGCPISHFHCSRFRPASRLELCSAPISELCSALKSELHSTFTSGVTIDVKQLMYVHPGLVRGLHSAGSVHTE